MHHLTQQVPTQRVVLTPTPPRRRRTPRPHHRSVCRASSSSSSPDPQPAGTTRGSLGVLTKTGKLVPQGLLVRVAKTAWNFVWFVFMNELAPQSNDKGKYTRPAYSYLSTDVDSFPVIDNADPAADSRYVLLVGNPCPWCHRVTMAAKIRNASFIKVVRLVDDAEKASRGGWIFPEDDKFLGEFRDLRELYDAFCGNEDGFEGRCTAPLLVDVVERKIVSNESSDVIEALDRIHVDGVSSGVRLRPPALIDEIDAFNDEIFDRLNNGVYLCGFSTTQTAYDESAAALFETLADLDARLANDRFLLGDRFCDADLRVFATISRFDAVYSGLFKCVKRVNEYPNLERWFLECARIPIGNGERLWDTVDVDDCRRSYFEQLFPLNPGGLVPAAPTAEQVFKRGVVDGDGDGDGDETTTRLAVFFVR